jgi:hypothetical protein
MIANPKNIGHDCLMESTFKRNPPLFMESTPKLYPPLARVYELLSARRNLSQGFRATHKFLNVDEAEPLGAYLACAYLALGLC